MSMQRGTTVGIDIGTTSVKAVAVDRSGAVVERARIPHKLLVPSPGRLEHDPNQAWRAGPRRALKAVGSGAEAVSIAAMAPSMTPVDQNGKPIGPGLLYGDERGHEPGQDTSAGISSGESAQFLSWLSREVPGAAGYWPATAVANMAIGKTSTIDFASAITGGRLFGEGTWDSAVIEAAGSRVDQLPAMAMMGAPIGTVTGTDAVLAAGSIDVFCEQLVSGADQPGDVLVLCGTTLIVWVVTEEQKEVPRLWNVPNVTSGKWMTGGASNAGGLFLGWVESLAQNQKLGSVLDAQDIPVWSPYIRGERTPFHDPTRRASLHGLGLTHGPDQVRRAAWEAAGFVVKHHIDLVAEPVRRIVAVGGGTRVDGWIQSMADATGLPVHVAAVPEGAALGAAYLAGMAIGNDEGAFFAGANAWARTGRIVEPDPQWHDAMRERYQSFRLLADG